jgi:hypothetical protein
MSYGLEALSPRGGSNFTAPPDLTGADSFDRGAFVMIRDTWLEAISAGLQEKHREYTPGALECLSFYLGEHGNILQNIVMGEGMGFTLNVEAGGDAPRQPNFLIVDNVAALLVQTFLPHLMGTGRNRRMVSPVDQFLPPPEFYGLQPITQESIMAAYGNPQAMQQLSMMQQQWMQYQQMAQQHEMEAKARRWTADMLEKYLNYTGVELGLKEELRFAMIESLVLGGGLMWTKNVDMPGGGGRLTGSFYVPMEDLAIDPDVRRLKDAKWIARKCTEPIWMAAQKYGIPEQDLRPCGRTPAAAETYRQLTIRSGYDKEAIHQNEDLIVYWEVYSRMGLGSKFRAWGMRDPILEQFEAEFADFQYLVVSEGCDYPLNLGPNVVQAVKDTAAQAMQMQAQLQQPLVRQYMAAAGQQPPKVPNPLDVFRAALNWPTPFWMDVNNPWPFVMIAYHQRTGSPWPIPHLQFVLSYMKFMVWLLSFIADKCTRSMRDFWVLDEKVAEKLREAIENDEDEAILEFKAIDGKTIKEFVEIISAPDVRKTALEIYMFFEQKFQRNSGLTDLAAGDTQRQMRSATEAQVLGDATKLRPEDMRSIAVDGQAAIAKKEAVAARTGITGRDIVYWCGQMGAQAWDTRVYSQDYVSVLRESSYDVDAGPGIKPDSNGLAQQAQRMEQFVIPTFLQIAQQTGLVQPYNTAMTIWAKSYGIDPAMVQLPDLRPMLAQQQLASQQPPPQQGTRGGGPGAPRMAA